MLKRIVRHREPIDSSVFVNPATQELFYDPFSLIGVRCQNCNIHILRLEPGYFGGITFTCPNKCPDGLVINRKAI